MNNWNHVKLALFEHWMNSRQCQQNSWHPAGVQFVLPDICCFNLFDTEWKKVEVRLEYPKIKPSRARSVQIRQILTYSRNHFLIFLVVSFPKQIYSDQLRYCVFVLFKFPKNRWRWIRWHLGADERGTYDIVCMLLCHMDCILYRIAFWWC